MKRDMEIIRGILLWAEADQDPSKKPESLKTFDAVILARHVKLLQTGGYVEAVIHESNYRGRKFPDHFSNLDLTWLGHEFLAAAQNDKWWKRLLEAGGTISLKAAQKILDELAVKSVLSTLLH